MPESLHNLLGDLHAERVRSWPAEDVAAKVGQRRELTEKFDPAAIKGAGSQLDNFAFTDTGGDTVTLSELVKDGPAVLIIFRFAGCPACNIALPHYQRNLWPLLAARGIPLIAISPQIPEPLGEIRTRHGLDFTVASDADNRFSRYLGITYGPNAGTQAYLTRKGINLRQTIGTSDEDLPQVTVLVIDREQVIRFINVTPDWLARTEAAPIIEAIDALVPQFAE